MKSLNKKRRYTLRQKFVVTVLVVVGVIGASIVCWCILSLTGSLPMDHMEQRKWSSYLELSDDVYRGDVQAVKKDLDRGVNPNNFPTDDYAVGNEWGMAVLSQAAGDGQTPMIRLLLSRGADPNICDGWDGTPLTAAAANDRVDVMALLFAHGAKVTDDKAWDSIALWRAAVEGKTNAVRFLLSHGANPNTTENTGRQERVLSGTEFLHQEAAAKLLRQAGAKE